MIATASRDRAAALQYGVQFVYGLGMAWPETKALVGRIYEKRMGKLPWLPKDWLAGVMALQQQYPDDLVIVAPARRPQVSPTGQFVSEDGPPAADLPLFLDSDAKLDAWQSIWRDMQKGRNQYAAAKAAAGRAELDDLYAAAAFWDGAYKIAVFARDLPSNVASGIGSGVVAFVGTFLPDALKAYAKWITWALVLLIVGTVLLWYRRRIAALFKGLKGKP